MIKSETFAISFFFSLDLIYFKNFRSLSISFYLLYPLRLVLHCLLQKLIPGTGCAIFVPM